MAKRYAMITGASSGIGREIARLLAKKGFHLILVARRKERLLCLQEEITGNSSVNVIVEECDVSKEQNCISLYEKCKKYPLYILVNNAGFGKVGNFEEIPLEEEMDMVKTNIMAPHILMKLFIRDHQNGYILNIASIAGFQPGPKMSAYGATKSYLLNLSMAVQYELKRSGKNIFLTTICPGPVNTEFNEVANAEFHVRSISAKKCAGIALNALFHKKNMVIPTWEMKVMHFMSKITPLSLVIPVEYLLQSKKIRK